jgi:hypothetical protein
MDTWYILIWVLALFDVIFWSVLLADFGHSDAFVIGPVQHAEYFCEGCGGLLDSEHGTCDWCDSKDQHDLGLLSYEQAVAMTDDEYDEYVVTRSERAAGWDPTP